VTLKSRLTVTQKPCPVHGNQTAEKYFAAKVEQLHTSDPHQWWTKTKRILNIQDSDLLASLECKGSPDQVAEAVNEFFVSVSAHLPKVNSIILDDLADDYSADFVIDLADVENRLARINIYKAAGPDGLRNWLLSDFAPYLSQPLAAIFNASIRLGYVPPVWKSAEVIPAPKLPRPAPRSTH